MSRFMYCAYFALFLAYHAAAQVPCGCFEYDTTLASSIGGASNFNPMTLEACQTHCASYKYFLVKINDCYCANNINTGFTWTRCATSCSTPCSGDTTQFCGSSTCSAAFKVAYDCAQNTCQAPKICVETLDGFQCMACLVAGCQQSCSETSDGFACSCQSGSLKNDMKKCVACPDAACEEVCTETSDGYVCSCSEGSSLDEDGKTCSAGPLEDPLKRCKKSFRYFLRHLKKCRSVSSHYPKWAQEHRKH